MSKECLLTKGFQKALATILITRATLGNVGTLRLIVTTWAMNHYKTDYFIELRLITLVRTLIRYNFINTRRVEIATVGTEE